MTQTIHLTEAEHRLPKWAQSELVRLRRNLAELERKLTERNVADSDTIADAYADSPLYLSPGEHIRFVLDDLNHLDVHIEEQAVEGRVINVQASGAAGPSLVVYPSSSNVVRIGAFR